MDAIDAAGHLDKIILGMDVASSEFHVDGKDVSQWLIININHYCFSFLFFSFSFLFLFFIRQSPIIVH